MASLVLSQATHVPVARLRAKEKTPESNAGKRNTTPLKSRIHGTAASLGNRTILQGSYPLDTCVPNRINASRSSAYHNHAVTCKAEIKEKTPPTADASPLVKLAWYGSEAFGKVVGVFKGGKDEEIEEEDEFGSVVPKEVAMEALRKDYDRSYFVTGNMSMGIYEEDCEFADPFVSFRGRKRFKQNVSNLGSFMEEVNLKILDWKEDEDKVTTKWRFSCVLGLPWRPILAAGGGTDHYFDKNSGKIYKHVERWDISPADGVRQLFKPNPKQRQKK